MKRQGQQVDVSVFVIGVNEAGAIEVLVYVTVADGSVAPADVLLDVVMVRAASIVFRKYHIIIMLATHSAHFRRDHTVVHM